MIYDKCVRNSTEMRSNGWNSFWRTVHAGGRSSDEAELVVPLSLFESSCFGQRKIEPKIRCFGHVTRGTIGSVSGLMSIGISGILSRINNHAVLNTKRMY